tara:strand:+ start:7580 stop:8215 length:636 start_codon:yes stop_codon:yes gene_type:complete
MQTEQSEFSKLQKKQLVFIAGKLVDDGFPSGNPYNDNDYDEYYKTLENIGKFFGMYVSDEDVQFFGKFLEVNDDVLSKIFDGDRSLIDKVVIPVAKSYNLHYNIWGTCTYEESLVQIYNSYESDWVMDSVRQEHQDGNFEMYDGNSVRIRYDDYEPSDHSFDNVMEINNNEVTESLLDRLVLENTSEVVSSLDRQTLLKLKSIIDSRLRSL